MLRSSAKRISLQLKISLRISGSIFAGEWKAVNQEGAREVLENHLPRCPIGIVVASGYLVRKTASQKTGIIVR